MTGRLVILSGPSGVGKDTVINEWVRLNPRVERVVAYTTRSPRVGEIPDVDYHFVSRDEFLKKAEAGDFLEYKLVYDNYYATPLKDMEAMLAAGKIAILKIDVQGALSAMQLRPDAMSVFILPPSEEELRRRIVERGSDEPEVVRKRLDQALSEIAQSDQYRHRIVNDSVENAVRQLEALVANE